MPLTYSWFNKTCF